MKLQIYFYFCNFIFLGFFSFSEGVYKKNMWTKCSDDKNSPDLNELERHLQHIQSRASNFEKQKRYALLEFFPPKTDIPGQQSFKGATPSADDYYQKT